MVLVWCHHHHHLGMSGQVKPKGLHATLCNYAAWFSYLTFDLREQKGQNEVQVVIPRRKWRGMKYSSVWDRDTEWQICPQVRKSNRVSPTHPPAREHWIILSSCCDLTCDSILLGNRSYLATSYSYGTFSQSIIINKTKWFPKSINQKCPRGDQWKYRSKWLNSHMNALIRDWRTAHFTTAASMQRFLWENLISATPERWLVQR